METKLEPTNKTWRVTGAWLDGSEYRSIEYESVARARESLNRVRQIALIDVGSLRIVWCE